MSDRVEWSFRRSHFVPDRDGDVGWLVAMPIQDWVKRGYHTHTWRQPEEIPDCVSLFRYFAGAEECADARGPCWPIVSDYDTFPDEYLSWGDWELCREVPYCLHTEGHPGPCLVGLLEPKFPITTFSRCVPLAQVVQELDEERVLRETHRAERVIREHAQRRRQEITDAFHGDHDADC